MIHLRLLILASRVVCGGIPIMSMVSILASHGHTVCTYGADGVFLVKKMCILPHTFDEELFSKNFMIDKRSNAHFDYIKYVII